MSPFCVMEAETPETTSIVTSLNCPLTVHPNASVILSRVYVVENWGHTEKVSKEVEDEYTLMKKPSSTWYVKGGVPELKRTVIGAQSPEQIVVSPSMIPSGLSNTIISAVQVSGAIPSSNTTNCNVQVPGNNKQSSPGSC